MFINCHLCCGFDNVINRNYDFDYIKKNIHPNLDLIDIVIWMGDFNYRVNKTVAEINEIYNNKKEMTLIEHDQMINEIKNYNLKAFGFKEGKIKFLPTYKYYENETFKISCDSIEHIPSWTDRIIYKISEKKFHIIEHDEHEKGVNESYENKEGSYYNESKDIILSHEEEEINSKEEENFALNEYNSMQNINFSDHKPVYAYFFVNIK